MTRQTTSPRAAPATDHPSGGRFQKVAGGIAALAVLLLVLRSDAGFAPVLDVAGGYALGISLVVAIWLLVQFIWIRVQHKRRNAATLEDPLAWYRAYVAAIRWGDILVALIALIVTVSCFTVYKGTVVGSDGYGFDAMIMAGALHSAGPVYDGVLFGDGATFGPLIDRLAAQNEAAGPFSAIFAQGYLLRLNELGGSGLGGGISAMPSMHIVLAFLWVLPAWHLNRVLGAIVTVYATAIWIGSVHLDWHYFVDGLVGVALLVPIWYVAGRTFGLYGRV